MSGQMSGQVKSGQVRSGQVKRLCRDVCRPDAGTRSQRAAAERGCGDGNQEDLDDSGGVRPGRVRPGQLRSRPDRTGQVRSGRFRSSDIAE